MYNFNEQNVLTSYVKQMLKDFNLPTCQAWVSGMQVYEGAYYIYSNRVSKALATGTFTDFGPDHFKVIYDNYKFGGKILNLTTRYNINNFIYDTATHEYLGEFLRFYRDYRGVDLMSMYNCFSNKEVSGVTIKDSTSKLLYDEEGYKIYAVPIVPFKEYTIHIDAATKIECVAGYYCNGLVNIYEAIDSSVVFPYRNTYRKYSDLRFSTPIVYDGMSKDSIEAWDDDVKENILKPITYNQRENLKLFIKIPSAVKTSSIVILEGNYSKYAINHFSNNDLKVIDEVHSRPYDIFKEADMKGDGDYDAPTYEGNGLYVKQTWSVQKNGGDLYIDKAENVYYPNEDKDFDQSFDRTYYTKLGLTKLQTGISHPFSNRLVEYLCKNAIVPYDDIDNNISRVQQTTYVRDWSKGKLNKIIVDGEWDKAIRNTLYGIARVNGLLDNKYDVIGYLDKDVETAISLED